MTVTNEPIEPKGVFGHFKDYVRNNKWLDNVPDIGAGTMLMRDTNEVDSRHLFYQPFCLTATGYVVTRLVCEDAPRLFGII